MTRQRFEELQEKEGFNAAMEQLWEESTCIKDYEWLKAYSIHLLQKDNVGLALHILNNIYNSEGDSEWFYYDVTAGTLCTPRCLNNTDDVEKYVGFEERR